MQDSGQFFGYDKVFHEQVKDGHKWARHVAECLTTNGIECHATDLEIASTKSEVKNFAAEQDVVLDLQPGWIEIKSRDLHFTDDPATFPYPTAFVDTCYGWDSKKPKPLAVVLVSKKTQAKLVISVKSANSWLTKTSYDRKRQIHDTWYLAQRSSLRRFPELVTFLRERQKRHQL